ncbi:benzoate 4-monooxygenase cytochrome P450 [Lasiosphaeria hispida]|uniref:Benzoate 4-monooxygenase cytochrome P450 n=1 Tax=Lasiosphaeria hispida TaxID=260671 RepID=A0AAJ0H8I4_9PEZI|nr:benzoate 4-monooxygenase cytochrome P450 [Lasiosphaeria hispida]
MSLFWWLVTGAVAVLIVAKYISHRRNPLNKFPGPLFCAISDIPYAYHSMVGDHPRWIAALHDKYGPVVHIAPKELAFITDSSIRDIYGYRKGHQVFTKSGAYDAAAFTAQTRSVVNERDPVEHARMRKMLAPAFSDRSLREQWPLVTRVCDTFMAEIGKHARDRRTVDLAKYFSLLTFDVITNLALGESFGSIESGKVHPWQTFFMNGARAMGDAIVVLRFPVLKNLLIALQPPQMRAMIKELKMHEAFTVELVRKRQESQIDRPDIIGRILQRQEVEETEFSNVFIAAQLSDVVIAGTDTTATALDSANYFLMKSPEAMQKLRDEIRGRFKRYEDITPATTADLPYLNAVIEEGLRLFSPVAWPPSRIVPPGGDTVDGHFLPGGTWVSTGYYAAPHSASNFKDPYEFHPERWLSNNPTDNLDASQPFGVGTRACIGKQLALTEIRLIMAKLHYKYDIEAVDKNFDWVGNAVFRLLWDKPALMVTVREREVVSV